MHKENPIDYTAKYFLDNERDVSETVEELEQAESNITDTPLYKALRQYRYETSKAEGIKAFYVYNNAQLEAVICGYATEFG